MRYERSRKRPRSSGIVCASPSRCSSTDAPEPPEEPRRSGQETKLRVEKRLQFLRALDQPALVLGLGTAARLLQPGHAQARLDERVEQVVDRLVARRRDPDALAAFEQVQDQPS